MTADLFLDLFTFKKYRKEHIFCVKLCKKNMSKQKENNWLNYGVRILVNTASHPVDYAKVLIQVGIQKIIFNTVVTIF